MFINHFSIDLQLQPGPNFTDRVNYTGVYNISDLQFEISFRVQCSENYYGPNCTTFCVARQSEYTCDSEGRFVCVQNNRDPTTNCSSCLGGYNPLLNCLQCLQGRDLATNCQECLSGYDPSTNCIRCLPGYVLTDGIRCTKQSTMESSKHTVIAKEGSTCTTLVRYLQI